MLRSDYDLLRHIQEETNFVLDHTQNKNLEDILNDPVLYRAIIRSLEIIGEASKKLSTEFKLSHTTIEWKKMAGTRDKLIHDYFGVDFEVVWDIIQNKLPTLKAVLTKISNAENFE